MAEDGLGSESCLFGIISGKIRVSLNLFWALQNPIKITKSASKLYKLHVYGILLESPDQVDLLQVFVFLIPPNLTYMKS